MQKISPICYNIRDIFNIFSMSVNNQFLWWPQVAESIEAREAREAADAQYEAEVANANFTAWAESLREDLGYAPFVPPEEVHDDRLYDHSSPEWEIYDRIAARVDTDFWGNPEILVPELFDEDARERNLHRADELFFSENILEEQMRSTGEGSPEENLQTNRDWFEANMQEGGTLSKAYERIRENFVLPPDIEGNNLQEIYENGSPEDALVVNDALSDAFLLELQQHTLSWRVNYPKEQVDALMRDISDPQNSPFEKLKIFGQIHTLIETWVWGRGRKQTEAFRNTQRRAAVAQEQSEAFYAAQTARIEAAEADNALLWRQDIDETEQEWHVWGWDVFAGWVFDVGLDDTWEEWRERA